MNQDTLKKREELVAEYKRLGRAMADETQPESDWRATKVKRDKVQAEIDAIDGKGSAS